MLRIGTAGIPIRCKGTSTLRGIECVRELGLSAMEIEFVRSIYLNEQAAREIGALAKKLDVSLSCHAPYALNLASQDKRIQEQSKHLVGRTLHIADECGASIAVVHAGYYSGRTPKEASEMILDALSIFRSRAKIGIETTGRQKQFGTLDEILALSHENKNIVPVVDFGHIHARTGGGIKTGEDFKKILDTVDAPGRKPIHCHMSCIKFENANEKEHLPLSAGQPDFRLLAQVLKENGYDATIISESPLIEGDAVLFKGWTEKSCLHHSIPV